MRIIKRDALIDETDILLFDILQELKKLTNKPVNVEEVKEEIKNPITKKRR